MKFKFYRQLHERDCGPTCIKMIARHYGKSLSLETIKKGIYIDINGASLQGISEGSKILGFKTRAVKVSFDSLINEVPLPCILHWDSNHYVVLVSYEQNRIGSKKSTLLIADPKRGVIKYSEKDLKKSWIGPQLLGSEQKGIALLLEPTEPFFDTPDERVIQFSWRNLTRYLKNTTWDISQIIIAFVFTSMLQLSIPFLTQSIVDTGIPGKDINFITVILLGQLMLLLSRVIVDFIKARILLGTSIIIDYKILSEFWIKLTSLPLAFFESHASGEIIQRISDNKLIQSFLTGPALSMVMSIFNFLLYGVILSIYNIKIFFIFLIGSGLYFFWIRLFLPLRRKLNSQIFDIGVEENNSTLEMVRGMQEIRINNAEESKRLKWSFIQQIKFKLNLKSLTFSQLQQTGAVLINQGKDLFITFYVARLVISGDLTLGAMLAIQYMLGQLSGPLESFIGFLQSSQDAKMSFERINEINSLSNEENDMNEYVEALPENKTIVFNHVSFSYPGKNSDPVLKDINIEILENKTTAIVGLSGSGKSTIIKLLLKFYDDFQGEIKIGNVDFHKISPSFWRKGCGAVLQDGYIFGDTVLGNIIIENTSIDQEHLIRCCQAANIYHFIEQLPNGFNTKIGIEGVGLSQGQKQRILIARALYKNPHFLFFDEATNSLDSKNEKSIVNNLKEIFKDRTVIVIAHRLSTIRNADKIIVLEQGIIKEQGTHDELFALNGLYFDLISSQVEIMN